MPVTTPQRRSSGAAPRRRAAPSAPVHDAHLEQIDRLAFLHEFAQLATHARDWDELMRTVVDRTTVAMGVEVCSFYLLDRDGQTLTLAATNGLDRSQVGSVSLSIGQGITGREPDRDTILKEGDVLVVFGMPAALEHAEALLLAG